MPILLLLSSCSLFAAKEEIVQISASPVEKPTLTLPDADRVSMRSIEWTLVTRENMDQVFADYEQRSIPLVMFTITDTGYENLGLNLSDIRAFIQQQQAIIEAYENYYAKSNNALDEANEEIEKANEEIEKIR
jgi:tRNA U34 5-methylaminomethyl-2-thiouridine-forming methyltransferase MnmC